MREVRIRLAKIRWNDIHILCNGQWLTLSISNGNCDKISFNFWQDQHPDCDGKVMHWYKGNSFSRLLTEETLERLCTLVETFPPPKLQMLNFQDYSKWIDTGDEKIWKRIHVKLLKTTIREKQ